MTRSLLPPSDDPAAAIDAIGATLARIAERDPSIGSFVCTATPADAEAAAREAAAGTGPLRGLAVAVKDILDTRDLPTAYGSPLYAGHRPVADAVVVAALRRAGAVIVGKTTTCEFAFLEPTATLNPNAPGRTPGGSSAGSAAAVAAGLVPAALGTQTGGSVNRPASYCGVVGLKPSAGLLPTGGLRHFSWSLDTVGVFARDVATAAAVLRAGSGRALAPAERVDRPWVVGVPTAYPWGEPSAASAAAVQAAAARWQAAGAQLRPVTVPELVAAAHEAHPVIQGWEAWRCLAHEIDRQPEALSARLRDYLRAQAEVRDADYEAAQQLAATARSAWPAALAPCDVWLTPAAPDEAPPLEERSTGQALWNRVWTLLGVPTLSLPGPRGPHGAPVGVQLVGRAGGDGDLLAAAAALEAAWAAGDAAR